jgi:hypothetical protein
MKTLPQKDFTEDTKIFSKAFNLKSDLSEIIGLLHGELPTRDNFCHYNLEAFNLGSHKLKIWWEELYFLLQHGYLEEANYVRKTDKLRQLLRNCQSKVLMAPTREMIKILPKIKDVQLIWDDGMVALKPKAQTLSKKDTTPDDLSKIKEEIKMEQRDHADEEAKKVFSILKRKLEDDEHTLTCMSATKSSKSTEN